MNTRDELIKKINDQGHQSPESPLPVVSLEDFFIGNSDYGSIGANLSNHPGPQAFYEILKSIRAKPTVQDILVEINEVVETDSQVWPFSDRVYVLSSASIEEIRAWLNSLQPDEVTEDWAKGKPPAAPSLKPGIKIYAAWWD